MTETISAPDTQAAASPQLPRPRTDADALRAIEDAAEHVRERALKIRASHDMPGRQAHIQDCVEEILAKLDAASAAG